jgi:hypothetical protein
VLLDEQISLLDAQMRTIQTLRKQLLISVAWKAGLNLTWSPGY